MPEDNNKPPVRTSSIVIFVTVNYILVGAFVGSLLDLTVTHEQDNTATNV